MPKSKHLHISITMQHSGLKTLRAVVEGMLMRLLHVHIIRTYKPSLN